ncbi:chromosomal replication initiator protein DnaA [Palleronia pelagia]|uniref:Chromosomal replication initiator protein DnaA n=1 Tax=Palleronia pelagia TaxID=387096 RepID=A0A1H8L765_9RHOB|nr:chromosomal replication initiator protein DnaA [Palleronia pelagia]SEO00957.1 chromosomal replication initiator protein [Palleronia pelagia]
MTQEIWTRVCERLEGKVGRNNFVAWIDPLQFDSLSDGVLTFGVPSNFMGNWVDRYFRDSILQEVHAQTGQDVRRLAFNVQRPANGKSRPTARATGPQTAAHRQPDAPRPAASTPAPAAAPAATPGKVARAPLSDQGAPLDERFTFDNFVVGKPNELAHAAARRVAAGGAVSFNPLFMYSTVGLGKTHLMHAIAWELRAKRPDLRVLYLSAEKFMYQFVQALRDKQMMNFKELFRSVDVLMVDDLQFIAGKDSTQEEFFHTFNALIDQRKQVILSADTAPGDIEGMSQRIVSRLQSGLVVDLHPTSYELRLGILQQKVEQFSPEFAGVTFDDGVLEFLAHRISSNVRELEGALTRLFAHGAFMDRVVDVPLAQECLRDVLRSSEKRVTIDEIQRTVADHFNIRLSDLLGPKRNRVYARPRQIAMYLSKVMTERSLPDIAKRFGGRDHTTIMHGVRRIEDLRQDDVQIEEDLTLLMRALGNR